MTTQAAIGKVAGIYRYPVKSMAGESLIEATLTTAGLLGDRAYALIDVETGRVVSAKSVKHFPDVLSCQASFVEPPSIVNPRPQVYIKLPNGEQVCSGDEDCDVSLSSYFGRQVRLASSAPEDFTIDHYYPDVSGADPAGNADTTLPQPLGAALFKAMGADSPVSPESFFDVFPLSVITTSTLDELKQAKPDSNFDQRRFRMNVVLKTRETGFIENDWIGAALAVGDVARLMVTMADPRCVMTTLAQPGIEQDIDVLKTLVKINRIQVGDAGLYPVAGVYAAVTGAGDIQVGDGVVSNAT
ncbi:MAG: MOSC N-terminal beta barrel domain-containing protein [Pseudomonadaceae bacterium]|nr:MOSC N-terminal beta barrel domain-containing protein [Pseudomonadaceae bacterium]